MTTMSTEKRIALQEKGMEPFMPIQRTHEEREELDQHYAEDQKNSIEQEGPYQEAVDAVLARLPDLHHGVLFRGGWWSAEGTAVDPEHFRIMLDQDTWIQGMFNNQEYPRLLVDGHDITTLLYEESRAAMRWFVECVLDAQIDQ